MNHKSTTWAALAASIFAGGALTTNTQGQSSDALLNTLLKKGVITEQEAKEIKAEASKENQTQFNQSFSAKTGMPSWINSYKLYGDFRGRFEENYADNSLYTARERYRVRLRIGLNVSMLDNFDVGLRLATGNPQTRALNGALVGGQSITANQDFNNLFTRKFIWLDAAYGRWTAIKNDKWTVTGTIGKMDNPFQLSNMVWDYDIAPEGAALQVAYNLNDQHTLKGNGGIFVLDEFNQPAVAGASANSQAAAKIHASHDPYLYGGQALLESKWTPKIDTSLGVAAFDIAHRESLSALVQPFYNAGNTRDALGFLKYNMNPIIGSASATYKIQTGPKTQFPIKLAGEYMKNPAAPSQNTGYRVGGTLGKAGRKNTWEINYRYQRLEADAWYDALEDDDCGVFYAPGSPQLAPFAGATASGWLGGTNLRGHQVVATYSFTDFLNFTFIYYLNEAIINVPGQSSKAGHFMAELNWKF